MWFILSAVVSAACSILLTKLVTLSADDFTSLLLGAKNDAADCQCQREKPGAEPQMYFICLFVTGLIFTSCVQAHWLSLSYASGVLGAAGVLVFIGALALGYRGLLWAESSIPRFYREKLHSFDFIDRAYASAKRRVS